MPEGNGIARWSSAGPHAIALTDFELRAEVRGQGLGRASYERLEASLGPDIKYVVLVADESSVGFWKKMGFSVRAADSEPGLTAMHKAINGGDLEAMERRVK